MTILDRVGIFYISYEMIQNNPGIVQKILNDCLITEAKAVYYSRTIRYVAYSDKFDIVPQGCIPNNYDIEIITDDFKRSIIQFKLRS